MKKPLHQFQLGFRKSIPALVLLFGVILDGSRVFYLLPVTPLLTLSLIYYWSIYRPDLLPPWVIFSLGIFQDIMGCCFIGQSTFLYLCFYGFVLLQRRYLINLSFETVWIIFSLSCLVLIILEWFVVYLIGGYFFNISSSLWTYLFAIFSYPWVYLLLNTLRKNKFFRV